MATGRIERPVLKDNSLYVLKSLSYTNTSSLSMSLPDIGAYPILFLYEGGDWNKSPIYGAIGLVRYYAGASLWNNAILLVDSGRVSTATVSDNGILTLTLTDSTAYNRLKLLSN